jgi:dTMP kinase
VFITFEGIDGSGKSTQIKRLQEHLLKENNQVEIFRDPGGPKVSERIRELLLSPDNDIDPTTELFLFSASRSQLMVEKVLPILEKGHTVILDRFYDSTTAYQGYGRNRNSLEQINYINSIASHERKPDLTFYMRVPFDVAKKRMGKKGRDRMEQAGDLFFEKVIEGFDQLATNEERIISIDATQPVDVVHLIIWEHTQKWLRKKNKL